MRGFDLRGLWTGALSWRQLGALVAALPPESLTKTALREALTPEQLAAQPEPTGHGQWSKAEHLLAAAVDRLSLLVWQNTQVHGGKRSQPPHPIPRPGVEPPEQRKLSARGAAYLADLREQRRQRRAGNRG